MYNYTNEWIRTIRKNKLKFRGMLGQQPHRIVLHMQMFVFLLCCPLLHRFRVFSNLLKLVTYVVVLYIRIQYNLGMGPACRYGQRRVEKKFQKFHQNFSKYLMLSWFVIILKDLYLLNHIEYLHEKKILLWLFPFVTQFQSIQNPTKPLEYILVHFHLLYFIFLHN